MLNGNKTIDTIISQKPNQSAISHQPNLSKAFEKLFNLPRFSIGQVNADIEPTSRNQMSSAESSTEIPIWVNAGLFDDILRNNLAEYQQIKSFCAKKHSCESESYKSQMLNINVETQLKDGKIRNISYRLIIKPTTASPTLGQTFLQYFTREAIIYHELLPIFEKIYRAAGFKLQLAPTCYKLAKNYSASMILLDDMTAKGYRSFNRIEGLNMLHTQEVLKKLAALHAASAVVFEKRHREFSNCSQPVLDSDSYLEFEKRTISYNRKFVENLRTINLREYQDHIKVYLQNFRNTLSQAESIDLNEFNVLNHGDCRTHNILFKYDAFGNIMDTIFVNFQQSKYGSPSQDLLYFIFSSIQLEDKLKNFDFFIKYYYDHLIANLKLLQYSSKLPKLTDLHLDILNNGCWAFTALIKILPFVLQDSKDTTTSLGLSKSMDTKLGESDVFDLMFRNPRYAEQAQKILPWLENRSFLEL